MLINSKTISQAHKSRSCCWFTGCGCLLLRLLLKRDVNYKSKRRRRRLSGNFIGFHFSTICLLIAQICPYLCWSILITVWFFFVLTWCHNRHAAATKEDGIILPNLLKLRNFSVSAKCWWWIPCMVVVVQRVLCQGDTKESEIPSSSLGIYPTLWLIPNAFDWCLWNTTVN